MIGNETAFGVNFADGRIKGDPIIDPRTGGDNELHVRYVRGNNVKAAAITMKPSIPPSNIQRMVRVLMRDLRVQPYRKKVQSRPSCRLWLTD